MGTSSWQRHQKTATKGNRLCEGLLTEALEFFFAGDLDTGKILLRDYVNATIGFKELSKLLKKKDTSLKRMLGPRRNPAADNLFSMTRLLQRQEGVTLKVIAERRRHNAA